MDIQANEIMKRITSSRTNLTMIVLAVLIIFFGSYAITGYFVGEGNPGIPDDNPNPEPGPADIETFTDTGREICTEDGKPVIRLFSTTTCPHCTWAKDIFDSVAREYVERGEIVAYHWELDSRDDTLTPRREGIIPDEEVAEFYRISGGSVPAFSMGCRYVRIGTGHERTNDKAAEADEFRAVIEKLIADSA